MPLTKKQNTVKTNLHKGTRARRHTHTRKRTHIRLLSVYCNVHRPTAVWFPAKAQAEFIHKLGRSNGVIFRVRLHISYLFNFNVYLKLITSKYVGVERLASHKAGYWDCERRICLVPHIYPYTSFWPTAAMLELAEHKSCGQIGTGIVTLSTCAHWIHDQVWNRSLSVWQWPCFVTQS